MVISIFVVSLGVKKKYMYVKNIDLYIMCNYVKFLLKIVYNIWDNLN